MEWRGKKRTMIVMSFSTVLTLNESFDFDDVFMAQFFHDFDLSFHVFEAQIYRDIRVDPLYGNYFSLETRPFRQSRFYNFSVTTLNSIIVISIDFSTRIVTDKKTHSLYSIIKK